MGSKLGGPYTSKTDNKQKKDKQKAAIHLNQQKVTSWCFTK